MLTKTTDHATPIVSVTGASGAGKTTLIDALLCLHPEFERVISCTTRPKRDSDPLGEYSYLTDEEFEAYAKSGAFLWMTSYADHRYGTLRRSVEEALAAKYPRIITLTPEMTVRLRALYPEGVLSFLILGPPDDVIRERLLARGDDTSGIEKRIASNREWGKRESDSAVPYLRIVNDGTVEEGVSKLVEALRAHHLA